MLAQAVALVVVPGQVAKLATVTGSRLLTDSINELQQTKQALAKAEEKIVDLEARLERTKVRTSQILRLETLLLDQRDEVERITKLLAPPAAEAEARAEEEEEMEGEAAAASEIHAGEEGESWAQTAAAAVAVPGPEPSGSGPPDPLADSGAAGLHGLQLAQGSSLSGPGARGGS